MRGRIRTQGLLRAYLTWPLIMAAILVISNLSAALVSPQAGAAMAGFTFVGVLIAGWLLLYSRRQILAGLVRFSSEYSEVQDQLLREMSVPYVLADEEGRILWANREFENLIREDKGHHKFLSSFFPELNANTFYKVEDDTSLHTEFGGRFYEVGIRSILIDDSAQIRLGMDHFNGTRMYGIFLFDETQLLTYEQELDRRKPVVGLIYLDNYDEALESVEAVRRSLLAALIDRKITKYIDRMEGIVKKLEKDKYFFVIQQKYTDELRDNRFSILEDVKTVNIGNDMAVTLSIGIGMNGGTYLQNYDYARAAIDMALGRGGDQAVVKDADRIRYYGGKSQQVEKTTRVKARVKAHAMRELMDTKDKILVMGHRIGDMDCFGAAVGIWRIAQAFNKKSRIVVNDVNSSVRPIMAKFRGNPDYPEDLFTTAEEAAEWADSNTMLVVVDVNRPSITEAPDLLKKISTIVVLDHHRQSAELIQNATLSYVEPYASSACEMVAEILQYIGDGIRVKPLEADAMYAGIMIDTHNFMNQAGVRTFEAAAFLRRNGADVVRVRKLLRDKPEDYRAKAAAIQNMEIYKGAYAISECPADGLESPTVVGAQAANEMLDITGIKASFVITQINDTVFYSARSIDEVNVQVMMEKLGGGGHRTIAGAQVKEISTAEARDRLKALIDEMSEKGEI